MRKYPPLEEGSHTLELTCPVCKEQFKVGDEVTLMGLWPADKEEALAAQQGRSYTVEARVLHWECRGNQE